MPTWMAKCKGNLKGFQPRGLHQGRSKQTQSNPDSERFFGPTVEGPIEAIFFSFYPSYPVPTMKGDESNNKER